VKPDRTLAMQQLLEQIREAMPFDSHEANVCTGQCNGCAKKLLDYLDAELEDWEYRLKAGDAPDFGEINQMAKTSRKIHKLLQKYDVL